MATVAEAVLLAFDLHAAGRAAEAEELCRRVLDADPEQPNAHHLLAVLLAKRGEGEEARARLHRVLALEPDRAEARAALAQLAAEAGERRLSAREPQAAETLFREGLGVAPGDARLWIGLADALFDQGVFDAAERAYRAVAVLAPHAHRPWYNAGLAACESGRMPEAAALFGRAVRLRPDNVDTRERWIATLYHAGRVEEARAAAGALLADKDRAAPSPPPYPETSSRSDRTRNVVAFSLWGGSPVYGRGAVENARATAERYPGWICRVYHDDSVPETILAELDRAGAERVVMESGSGPALGLFWRFLVSDDPAVDRFLCRDADSRINAREQAAVADWIASGAPFHVMRDHILHTELMLAGMWGGRAGLLPPLEPLIRRAVAAPDDRLRDQRFLAREVWPRIRGRCLVHDSAHPGHGAPFPDVGIDACFAFTHVGACVKDIP